MREHARNFKQQEGEREGETGGSKNVLQVFNSNTLLSVKLVKQIAHLMFSSVEYIDESNKR